jgi:hypothetical protein
LGDRTAAVAERVARPSASPVSYPENLRFKDLHVGRRAFVIGNGPSLASQDLSALKGELLFTMNSFDQHPLCKQLRPFYHFIADPAANENSSEREAFLARIADGIGDSPVFARAWSLESVTLRQWYSGGRLHLVPNVGPLADETPSVLDMCVGFPGVQTTAQLALMTAIYMGCNPVYLMGLDSDWAATGNLGRHFYPEPAPDESEAQAKYDLYWTYEHILEATLSMWKGYRNLWEFCNSSGVEVYNCTAGGLLDVFPRKRFEDVVGDAHDTWSAVLGR